MGLVKVNLSKDGYFTVSGLMFRQYTFLSCCFVVVGISLDQDLYVIYYTGWNN